MKREYTKEEIEKTIILINNAITNNKHNKILQTELYKFLSTNIDLKKINVDDFQFTFLTPYHDILESLINNENYSFFLLNLEFYEHQLDKIMEKLYGSSCSHDKTVSVMREYEQYLLSSDYDINKDWEDKTVFNIPNTLSKKDWINFIDSIQQLWFGNIDEYLEPLSLLMKKHEEEIASDEYKIKMFKKSFKYYYNQIKTCSSPEQEFDSNNAKLFIEEYAKNLIILQKINEKLENCAIIDEINQECSKLIFDLKSLFPKKPAIKFNELMKLSELHHNSDEKLRKYNPVFDTFFKRYTAIEFIKKGIN